MDKSNLFQNFLNFFRNNKSSSNSQLPIDPLNNAEQLVKEMSIDDLIKKWGGKVEPVTNSVIRPDDRNAFEKAQDNTRNWLFDRQQKIENAAKFKEKTPEFDILNPNPNKPDRTDDSKSGGLLDKYADVQKAISDDQLKAAFMMKGIDIAGKLGEGGMRAADSYDNLTRSIAAIAGALPEYKSPGFTISPMAYQNYAFGRG